MHSGGCNHTIFTAVVILLDSAGTEPSNESTPVAPEGFNSGFGETEK